MRTLTVLLLLAVSQPVYGERMIIPVYAHIVHGSDGSFGSHLRVTNLARHDVTVRIAEMYAAAWVDACAAPVARTIAPAASDWIYPPDGCRGIFSLVLEADGPVQIEHDISSVRSGITWHTQRVGTAAAWIPPFRDAILAALRIDLPTEAGLTGAHRTNLFVVNPNDEPLQFEMSLRRSSQDAPSRDVRHVIAARSVAILPLDGLPDRWCDGGRSPRVSTVAPNCSTAYDLTFRADGAFYASASTVAQGGDAQFHEPAVLH